MLDLNIRLSEIEDVYYLEQWLDEDVAVIGFPAISREGPLERHDAALQWISYARYQGSITAECEGVPVGMATLFLMGPEAIAHQSELGIIVSPEFRGRGIGSKLIKELIDLAKNIFSLEELFLFVSEGNPAEKLYRKFGFQEVGKQVHWSKHGEGKYKNRIAMQKSLVRV